MEEQIFGTAEHPRSHSMSHNQFTIIHYDCDVAFTLLKIDKNVSVMFGKVPDVLENLYLLTPPFTSIS